RFDISKYLAIVISSNKKGDVMSSEDITPQQEPAEDTREVTVKDHAHRGAQFERFHQRFLEMAAHWDSQVGNEDLRGPRGRRGRRGPGGRHFGPRHGHAHPRHDETETTEPAA